MRIFQHNDAASARRFAEAMAEVAREVQEGSLISISLGPELYYELFPSFLRIQELPWAAHFNLNLLSQRSEHTREKVMSNIEKIVREESNSPVTLHHFLACDVLELSELLLTNIFRSLKEKNIYVVVNDALATERVFHRLIHALNEAGYTDATNGVLYVQAIGISRILTDLSAFVRDNQHRDGIDYYTPNETYASVTRDGLGRVYENMIVRVESLSDLRRFWPAIRELTTDQHPSFGRR